MDRYSWREIDHSILRSSLIAIVVLKLMWTDKHQELILS